MWPFRHTNTGGKISSPANIKQPAIAPASQPTAPAAQNRVKSPQPSQTSPSSPVAAKAPSADPVVDTMMPRNVTPPAYDPFTRRPTNAEEQKIFDDFVAERRAGQRRQNLELEMSRAEAEAREVERRKAAQAAQAAEAERLAKLPPTFEKMFGQWRTPLNGLNRKFVDYIVQRGELSAFVAEARQKCAPHIKAFADGWKELSKFSRDEVRRRVRDSITTNLAAAKNGDVSAVVDVIDEDQIFREYDFRRKALRERLRAASTACKPSVTAFAEKFQSTCRSIAGQMVAEEKSAAEAIGVQFDQPSAALKQIIACGFEGEDFLNAAFHPSPSSDPADALCGLLKSE